jgi:Zn-dependent protease with chaperone function
MPRSLQLQIASACDALYESFENLTRDRQPANATDLRIDIIGRRFSRRAPANGVWHFEAYPSKTPMAAWNDSLEVFISEGVLNTVSNDDELAAVIAHAVAHARYASHAESWQWFTQGCRARRALDANESGEWHEPVADALRAGGQPERANESLLSTLRMANEHAEEMTVDRIALQLLASEGYDLDAYPRVMALLDEDAGWLAMHPDSDDRRRALAVGMRKSQ